MIEMICESCGKHLKAPREAAGKQATCPYCGKSLYIPTPIEEIEELPLAPEDESELQQEARLQAERRRLDMQLAHENESSSSPTDASTAPHGSSSSPTGTLESAMLAYLSAMRDSQLPRAEEAIAILRQQREAARKLLDRLAADQIPPPVMAKVPPAVYQGFLKNLRNRLG